MQVIPSLQQHTFSAEGREASVLLKRIEEHFDDDPVEAENDATTVCDKALVLVRRGFSANGTREIPFHLALKTVDILSKESMQYFHSLKRILSLACCRFLELSLLNGQLQKTRVPSARIERFYKKIEKIRGGVPKSDYVTKFQLDCCQGALILLRHGKIKPTEFASEVEFNLLRGGKMPDRGIRSPCIYLSRRPFCEKLKWYPSVLRIKEIGYQVRSVEDSENDKVQMVFQQFSISKGISRYTAYCLIEMFMSIVRDREMPMELKTKVIDEGSDHLFPDLRYFARYQELKKRAFNEHKIQCFAIERIIELSRLDTVRDLCIKILAEGIIEEKDPRVLALLLQAYHSDSQAYDKVLKDLVDHEGLESSRQLDFRDFKEYTKHHESTIRDGQGLEGGPLSKYKEVHKIRIEILEKIKTSTKEEDVSTV